MSRMDRDTRMALLSRRYRLISPTIMGTTDEWSENSIRCENREFAQSGHFLRYFKRTDHLREEEYSLSQSHRRCWTAPHFQSEAEVRP